MNWTGGRLSRHSRNGPGTLTHRQKQHFAKQRSNITNNISSTAPTDWSVFGVVERVSPQQNTELIGRVRPAGGQFFDQSVDDHRSSSRPRKRRRHDSSRGSSQAADDPPVQRLPDWKVGIYDERYMKNELDNDVNGGTTQLVPQAKQPTTAAAEDVVNTNNGDISFKERRQSILHKNDWVGANIQHPIKLKFTTTNNDGRLGKRRRISAGHQNQFAAIRQPMITSPFAVSRLKLTREAAQVPQNNESVRFESGPSTNHIRISIGGRQLPAGVGSNGSQGRSLRRLTSPQASTSDIMLLDIEDKNTRGHSLQHSLETEQQSSTPVLPLLGYQDGIRASEFMEEITRTPHRRQINSSYGRTADIESWSATKTLAGLEANVSKGWRVGKEGSGVSRYRSQLDPMNYHPQQTTHTPMRRQPNLAILPAHGARLIPNTPNRQYVNEEINAPREDDSKSTSPPVNYITNVSKQLSESARRLQSVARDKSRQRTHLSLQTRLMHPVPQSSIISRVLRSTSSDAGSSTVAQLGATKPFVSPSQLMDEELWQSWVLEADEGRVNSEHHDIVMRPGINSVVKQNQPAQKPMRRDNPEEAWMKFILSDDGEEVLDMTHRGSYVPNPTAGANNSSINANVGSDSSLDPLSTDLPPLPLHPQSETSATSIPRRQKITFSKPLRFSTRRGRGSSSPDPLTLSGGPSVHIGSRSRIAVGKGRRERDVYSLESEEDAESIED